MADTKTCPFCAEIIQAAAVLCRFCGSELASSGTSALGDGDAIPTRPLPGAPSATDLYAIEITDTRTVPVDHQIAFFEVQGVIKNLSTSAHSFHLAMHGRRMVGQYLHQVGLMGQTETQVLKPGQAARWVAKIITSGAQPEALAYRVDPQDRPGEIEVFRVEILDDPDSLGAMKTMALGQVAMQVASFNQQSAPEGNWPA